MNKLLHITSLTLFPVIAVLILFQLYLSNDLASSGAKIELYDRKIEALQGENELLQRQVAVLGSLETIANKAKEAGFVKTVTYLNVPSTQPVALR
jgi:cell division protein FtsL